MKSYKTEENPKPGRLRTVHKLVKWVNEFGKFTEVHLANNDKAFLCIVCIQKLTLTLLSVIFVYMYTIRSFVFYT